MDRMLVSYEAREIEIVDVVSSSIPAVCLGMVKDINHVPVFLFAPQH